MTLIKDPLMAAIRNLQQAVLEANADNQDALAYELTVVADGLTHVVVMLNREKKRVDTDR